jgi:hypothetical protein
VEIADVRRSHPCEERDRYENDAGEHPLDEVSPELLMKHVHEISRYIRISGGKEEELSLKYVKRILKRYRLKVREYSCPAYIGYPQHALLEILSPDSRIMSGVSAALAPSSPRKGVIFRNCLRWTP